MENLVKFTARLMGWTSFLLGVAALAQPRKIGKLFAIDTAKPGGLMLCYWMALRDLVIGLVIIRARDNKALRLGVSLRMLGEISDSLTFTLGRGIILQPQGRKIISLTIPPILVVETFVRQNLKV